LDENLLYRFIINFILILIALSRNTFQRSWKSWTQ